jgi:sugar/nucleoside kinase (ribokinase family)
MSQYDVYGIGNALVDTEYEVSDDFLEDAKLEKGVMTLIDATQRHALIQLLEEKHEHKVIQQCGGGSAANTMVAVAQLGGKGFYSCKVASDSVGDFFMGDLAKAGIKTNLDSGRDNGDSGQCISMVTPDAERSMTTHLGISETLSEAELDEEALKNSTYLYIEGYLVTSPSAFAAARKAQDIARANGVQVSLTLSDPAIVENFKSAFDEFAEHGIDLVFCNEEEAKIWTASKTNEEAFSKLKLVCGKAVMTMGKEGAMTWDGSSSSVVAGVPTKAVDTTGAGDIFAGTFLGELSKGRSYPEAAATANRAASKLVSQFGARLTLEEMQAAAGQ